MAAKLARSRKLPAKSPTPAPSLRTTTNVEEIVFTNRKTPAKKPKEKLIPSQQIARKLGVQEFHSDYTVASFREIHVADIIGYGYPAVCDASRTILSATDISSFARGYIPSRFPRDKTILILVDPFIEGIDFNEETPLLSDFPTHGNVTLLRAPKREKLVIIINTADKISAFKEIRRNASERQQTRLRIERTRRIVQDSISSIHTLLGIDRQSLLKNWLKSQVKHGAQQTERLKKRQESAEKTYLQACSKLGAHNVAMQALEAAGVSILERQLVEISTLSAITSVEFHPSGYIRAITIPFFCEDMYFSKKKIKGRYLGTYAIEISPITNAVYYTNIDAPCGDWGHPHHTCMSSFTRYLGAALAQDLNYANAMLVVIEFLRSITIEDGPARTRYITHWPEKREPVAEESKRISSSRTLLFDGYRDREQYMANNRYDDDDDDDDEE